MKTRRKIDAGATERVCASAPFCMTISPNPLREGPQSRLRHAGRRRAFIEAHHRGEGRRIPPRGRSGLRPVRAGLAATQLFQWVGRQNLSRMMPNTHIYNVIYASIAGSHDGPEAAIRDRLPEAPEPAREPFFARARGLTLTVFDHTAAPQFDRTPL